MPIAINLNQTQAEWSLQDELHSVFLGALLGSAILFVGQAFFA